MGLQSTVLYLWRKRTTENARHKEHGSGLKNYILHDRSDDMSETTY